MEGATTPRRARATTAVLLAVLAGCTATPTTPPTPAPGGPAPSAATAPAATSTGAPSATSTATATATAKLPSPNCRTSVRSGPLPVWARAGFTGDGSSFRHVEGFGGVVVGVVFGDPLTSPPQPDRANKILWVARQPTSGRLTIDARRNGTGPVVRREVGFGGGQSVVDLPRPGCWRLTLRWDALTDTVDLPYAAG